MCQRKMRTTNRCVGRFTDGALRSVRGKLDDASRQVRELMEETG